MIFVIYLQISPWFVLVSVGICGPFLRWERRYFRDVGRVLMHMSGDKIC